jgi:arsenate reductase-like glutaredoxin family protein
VAEPERQRRERRVGSRPLSGPRGAGPGVQVFGRRDSRASQKAQRFFRERSVPVAFVDLAVKAMALGELRRFADRLGAEALIDTDGRRYRELGLAYLRFEPQELLERLLADQSLLRLPLVRLGDAVAVGPDEIAWKTWLTSRTKA